MGCPARVPPLSPVGGRSHIGPSQPANPPTAPADIAAAGASMKSRTGTSPPSQSMKCRVRSLYRDRNCPSGDMPSSSFQSGLSVNRVRRPVTRLTDQTWVDMIDGPPTSTYVASAPPLVNALNSVSALLSDQSATFGSEGELGAGGLITRGSLTTYSLPLRSSLPTTIVSKASER